MAVRHCVAVCGSAVVCGSARGSVRQCGIVCGSAAVCDSARGSVQQCAAVCGNVRQCAAMCGSVRLYNKLHWINRINRINSVRQHAAVLAAECTGSAVVCGMQYGSVRQCSNIAPRIILNQQGAARWGMLVALL
jgi:Na+-translocating ferredoxin:NAD+ oxidoreductase RnfC subunit